MNAASELQTTPSRADSMMNASVSVRRNSPMWSHVERVNARVRPPVLVLVSNRIMSPVCTNDCTSWQLMRRGWPGSLFWPGWYFVGTVARIDQLGSRGGAAGILACGKERLRTGAACVGLAGVFAL